MGGGSTYTPELVNGFLARLETLPVTELWLMDIDPVRLDIVGGFAKRMVTHKGNPFKVVLSTNQREAVDGAAYVSTQLRVGQMPARRDDEYLGRRHNLIGQETTGIGGMAKALRTIPVILSIAKDMRELAPGALLVNFTNPAGLITQALSMFAPDVPAVGVCNVAIHAKMDMAAMAGKRLGRAVDPSHCELDTLGLNHLTWHRGFTVDSKDMWPEILREYIEELKASDNPDFPVDLVETLRVIPNYYLQYFYRTGRKLADQQQWPPSRGEEVMEIEKDLLREYADPSLNEPPADLMKRGGAYYSTAATQLMNAHFNDLGETHVVNTVHGDAVDSWPEDWVLEMPCKIDRQGIHPLPAEPLPPVFFGLIAQVKSYEILTAQAAVSGDRNTLYQAMLAHPLGPEVDEIESVMEDLLTTHRPYLPNFFKD
ncbi:MAG: 6-phospho-beta-glucosidase [Chloroflexi bacterium]|nr:6-phospho-beta-glucosidase [Chloroflexota bacterium]